MLDTLIDAVGIGPGPLVTTLVLLIITYVILNERTHP